MDEIIKKLAEQVGVSPDVARNGLGAVLAFLKGHLPDGLFGEVEKSVPDAQGLVNSFEANKAPESSGGLFGAVAGLAGKLLGGGAGDATKLLGMLGSAGLSMGQITAFLPKVLEMLQAHLPPDLLEKIKGLIAGAVPTGDTTEKA